MRASTIGRSFPHTHNLTLALALALALTLTRLEHRPILPPQLVLVRARAVRIVDIPVSGAGGVLSFKGPEGLPLSLARGVRPSGPFNTPPVSGMGRRPSAMSWRPFEGRDWRTASKGLRPQPTRRTGAVAHGCGMCGRVLLPLPRAAAVSTGLRVPFPRYAHVGLAAAPPASGALALALL